MTLWTLILGLVLLVAVSAPQALAINWSEVPLEVHAGIAYLGIINTAVTFMLVKYAGTRIPSAKVMAYTFLTPVFVVLLEGALGRGWPALIVWGGLAVTVAATAAFAFSRVAAPAPTSR
jgi:drug/metabolite transporter (DMT)-like permease